MNCYQTVSVDPWLKNSTDQMLIPDDAVLACVYGLDIGIDCISEAAYFRRSERGDEIWIAQGVDALLPHTLDDLDGALVNTRADNLVRIGVAVTAPERGKRSDACVRILGDLICSRVGHAWPTGLVIPGIVSEEDFDILVDGIECELQQNADKARVHESAIVQVARELRLSPQPTGTGPHHWQARCPGASHFLLISSYSDEFGCGYCRRRGGVEELRLFVNERRNTGKRR